MVQRNSNIYTLLRSLKKPTILDKIIDSVPKPKGAVPNFGLPRWKTMPLDTKIPIIPGPKDAYNFSRNKLGKTLYRSSRGVEFDLTDPNNYEFGFKYDALHDEHLAHYFSNKNMVKRLMDLGFVTKDYDAACSIKEYNMYRNYLKKLHNQKVKRQLKRIERTRTEQRTLNLANAAAQKEAAILLNNENVMNARRKMKDEIEHRAADKRQRQILKLKMTERRLKMAELRRNEKHEQMILRGRLRDEHAKLKQRLVAEKERQRIVGVLLKSMEKEQERRRWQQERNQWMIGSKDEDIAKKWYERQDYQQLQLTVENFVREYAAEEARRNIEKYMKKIENEQKKLQRKIKNNAKFWQCYKIRRSTKAKKCCKISKIDRPIVKNFKSYGSFFDEPDIDEYKMAESSKSDIENEFCMDLRQWHV